MDIWDRLLLTLLLAAGLPLGGVRAAGRDEALRAPEAVYTSISSAVVGIDCWPGSPSESPGDPYAWGTGVIIDPRGLVLTSITVAPPEVKRIRVYLRGGRTTEAERLRSIPEMELVLLKLRSPAGAPAGPYPFLHLGDSSRLRVGQIAYTLGNAFHSISDDDQVTFAVGAISGGYVLAEARDESRYLGPAIETTAAVNDGMDGGPLVNGGGEMVGLISLNFSKSRWLGTAIPINALKPMLADHLGSLNDRLERFPAYLGLELGPPALLEPPGARPVGAAAGEPALAVLDVDPGGPAERAGVKKGDRLLSWQGQPLKDAPAVRERLRAARAGQRVKLEIERGGARREIEVVLWGRF